MVEPASTGIVFWILAAVILVSGFMVVSLRNIFHCAIFLIICLSGVAGVFILLGAEFLAAAQVLIYVGAVSILMIFAIMLTTRLASREILQTNQNATVAFFSCMVFAASAIALLWVTSAKDVWNTGIAEQPTYSILTLGKLLMTQFVVPFEVVSVLLLGAMIGAIVLARGAKS